MKKTDCLIFKWTKMSLGYLIRVPLQMKGNIKMEVH